MSLYHLYAAYGIVTTTTLRYVHVAFMLFLVFLLFPAVRRLRHRFSWIDLICALVGVATSVYALIGGDAFLDRSTAPNTLDIIMGGRADSARAGSGAAFHRLDHAVHMRALCRLRDGRSLPAAHHGRIAAMTSTDWSARCT